MMGMMWVGPYQQLLMSVLHIHRMDRDPTKALLLSQANWQ